MNFFDYAVFVIYIIILYLLFAWWRKKKTRCSGNIICRDSS